MGAVVSAETTRAIAKAKGLNSGGWWVAGFSLGPIGLIGAAGMPDRKLRYYMKALAIKLEAIDLQDIESTKTKECEH